MFASKWFGIFLSVLTRLGEILAQDKKFPENITTCEDFEIGARFDPIATIHTPWKIFYFWSNMTEVYPVFFTLAAKNRIRKFREIMTASYPEDDETVDWDQATLVMEPRPGIEVMLIYQNRPGSFQAIVKKNQNNKVRPVRKPLIQFAEMRIKQVKRYMCILACEDLTAYALAKVEQMPSTEEDCEKAASLFNYKGYEGRSYLYLKRFSKTEDL